MQLWRHARTWLTRVRELPPRPVLIAGYVAFVVYGFPGYLSPDSVMQLTEARTLKFSDGHPPLMAAEWALLDRIVSGPLLMLLLQGALMLGGLFVLLRHVMSARHAAWTAIALLLFPPILTPMVVIWKDTQMAAYLVAGLAALVQPRLRWRLIGLGILLAACLMRHNAVAAAAPLVGFVFEWRKPLQWWKRLLIMIAAGVLAVGALFGVSRVVASRHVRLTPVFTDIVGMISFTRERSDAELLQVLQGVKLAVHTDIQAKCRRVFEMRGVWRVAVGEDRIFETPETEEQWAALYRAWKELITDDPGAYVAAHWDMFQSVLGIDQIPRAPVYDVFLDPPEVMMDIGHNAYPSSSQQSAIRLFYWLAENTPLFRPYIYAAIAILLLLLVCRDRVTFGLLTSGLLYELSFVPAFAEPDYRYSHWMITSTCIATVMLFVQRRRKNP